jgi:hypothetical protein
MRKLKNSGHDWTRVNEGQDGLVRWVAPLEAFVANPA